MLKSFHIIHNLKSLKQIEIDMKILGGGILFAIFVLVIVEHKKFH